MSKVLKDRALFLDLDGTLVDIAATPDGICVPGGLAVTLDRLTAGLSGALAIISGRAVWEIDSYLRPLKPVAAGIHGAELRTIPCGQVSATVEPLEESILHRVMKVGALDAKIIIEPKRYSVAVHYRNAEHTRREIETALQCILEGSGDHLILSHGRKVFEIVPRQISKGMALAALMEQPAFRGRIPVMVGDDVSDLSAFDMAVRLGGAFQRVAGEHFAHGEAEFESPAHVRAWLLSLSEQAKP